MTISTEFTAPPHVGLKRVLSSSFGIAAVLGTWVVSVGLTLVGWSAITVFRAVSAPDTAVCAILLIGISLPAYLWLKRVRHLQ